MLRTTNQRGRDGRRNERESTYFDGDDVDALYGVVRYRTKEDGDGDGDGEMRSGVIEGERIDDFERFLYSFTVRDSIIAMLVSGVFEGRRMR